ncbi:MAG TPA: Fe(3+) ABC transporter substrate-binding protein [Hyphomicrobiaceae bacterium]|nr:Fe(3+) ABC transporter substrate-binding protein [Hyphomicrobiaceae bacterium]
MALAVAAYAGIATAALAAEVNIYSYRQPQLIDPLLKAFTKKTGIKTNIVYASAGLNERLAAEGRNSPADLLLTVDAGLLSDAKNAGLTQPVVSDVLTNVIPAHLRDPDNHWFALTMRGRVVYASKERVKQDSITYEELSDPKWKGKICIRSGQHVYNTSLIATIIAHKGEAFAEQWLKGVKENLAHKPAGGDREQARDIASGNCDIALGNTYYMGLMAMNEKNPEQKQWAAAIRPLFPNANDRGTHVNVSGVAMTKNAPNKAAALKLIEFLVSEDAQKMYAAANNEYPVRAGVALSPIVASWGTLKADSLPLENIGKYRKRASELVDKVNFDGGPST